MTTYPPNKMVPKCAVDGLWGYYFNGKERVMGFCRATKPQRKIIKKHHRKRCRAYGKYVIEEETKW
jgi:hypothetical protein